MIKLKNLLNEATKPFDARFVKEWEKMVAIVQDKMEEYNKNPKIKKNSQLFGLARGAYNNMNTVKGIPAQWLKIDKMIGEGKLSEGKLNEDYSQRARNFRVNLRTRLKDMKPGKTVGIDKVVFKKLPSGDGFTDTRGKFFDHEAVVQAIQKGPAAIMIRQNSARSPRGAEQVNAYVKFGK
tara:strand:+ start:65 stop:604 length:540 start_codon:yes stop_codon:yes gene_type:complete